MSDYQGKLVYRTVTHKSLYLPEKKIAGDKSEESGVIRQGRVNRRQESERSVKTKRNWVCVLHASSLW